MEDLSALGCLADSGPPLCPDDFHALMRCGRRVRLEKKKKKKKKKKHILGLVYVPHPPEKLPDTFSRMHAHIHIVAPAFIFLPYFSGGRGGSDNGEEPTQKAKKSLPHSPLPHSPPLASAAAAKST